MEAEARIGMAKRFPDCGIIVSFSCPSDSVWQKNRASEASLDKVHENVADKDADL